MPKEAHPSQPITFNGGDKVLAVGPYPPPITGQAVAFKAAVDGLRLEFVSNWPTPPDQSRASFLQKVGRSIKQAWAALKSLKGKRVLYISASSTTRGMARDSIFILPALALRLRVVAHIQQGSFSGLIAGAGYIQRRYIFWLYNQCHTVIVLSDCFVQHFSFLPNHRIRVVANSGGPSTDEAPSAPVDAVRILYLSNLMEHKGFLQLIKAMKHLPHRYTLTLAGQFMIESGDTYETPEALEKAAMLAISSLEQPERVTYAGVVAGQEKALLLKTSHVLVLPSYYRHEGQPVCVAEAMLAGIPAVTTPHRDLVNMVDNTRGHIIEDTDPKTIAVGIRTVCSDPDVWASRSSAAKTFAQKNYSEGRYLQELGDILSKAVHPDLP